MPVKASYELVEIPRAKSFSEFLNENDLSVVVREVTNGFFAEFRPLVEARGREYFSHVWLWGKTPDEAVERLAIGVRGSTLRITRGDGSETCVVAPDHWREI